MHVNAKKEPQYTVFNIYSNKIPKTRQIFCRVYFSRLFN
ncbi:hypothetical protein QF028_001300 [Neobacillus sp. B4I6]